MTTAGTMEEDAKKPGRERWGPAGETRSSCQSVSGRRKEEACVLREPHGPPPSRQPGAPPSGPALRMGEMKL